MPASKGSMAGHSAQRTGLHEPIEELPDRRLHFSRSVTLVSLCTMSYAFWIFYLCGHSESEATLEFYRVVPPTVYMWPMVAFATAVLLNLLSMAMERRPVKRQLCFLNVYISGVAFVFEFLAWKQSAPIYINAAGRPTSLMRFVMWAHATPIMLYTLSLISDFSTKQLYQTLGVNVFMIVAVIPGELIPGARLDGSLPNACCLRLSVPSSTRESSSQVRRCRMCAVPWKASRLKNRNSMRLAAAVLQAGAASGAGVASVAVNHSARFTDPPAAAWHRWVWNSLSCAVYTLSFAALPLLPTSAHPAALTCSMQPGTAGFGTA
jgi:hypothetical protein